MQKKSSGYMRDTASKSTPANNAIAINTLAKAQQAVNNLSKFFGYDNIVNIQTMENDIKGDIKSKPKNRLYAGEGMSGILNIGTEEGKEKSAQEDSVLMMTHPENNNFKLALIADGIGGMGNGDAASYIATSETMDWFKNLPSKFYNSDSINLKYQNGKKLNITFEEAIKQHLVDVNNKIVKYLGSSSGTTFSAAIIRNKNGRDIATSVSIGDSKILKISPNGEVIQLSKDDNSLSEGMRDRALYIDDSDPDTIYTSNLKYASKAQYRPRNQGSTTHVLSEDDMRFYKHNNIINGYLGGGQTRRAVETKAR